MTRPDRSHHLHTAALLVLALLSGCTSSFPTITKKPSEYRVTHPGKEINSSADDVAPQLAPDGSSLYSTSNRETRENPDGLDRIYRSARGEQEWQSGVPAFAEGLASGKAGALCFDPAHGQAMLVRCFQPGGVGDCDLCTVSLAGDGAVRNPGEPLNNKEWDSHPTLTADGRTLYFASERHGGKSGSDLYAATRNADGGWSVPVNLGEPINTAGEEITPFISGDGQTLWFSSSSPAGYGGIDIFRSTRKGNAWTVPVNMGAPFNTSDDDIFFVTTASGDSSYLASTRDGGFGSFDIYEIVKLAPPPPPPPPPVREPLVVRYTAKNAFTLDPVPASITLATHGEKDIALRADQSGKARTEVLDGREYAVKASSPGFISGVDTFLYPLKTVGTKERSILLMPVFEAERKIYAFVVEFDFNYSNIRPEEKKNLDSAVSLLSTYPNSTVVVSGHTDSVGTDMYNMRLGYSRASEVSGYVEKYLLERVKKLRHKIEIRTYGESQPVATNSTDEGRQRNRRVEIAIIRNE